LNQDEIRRLLSTGISKWLNTELEYLALGIVNLDAIPASKRHLPIGEAGNPIPLIKFKEMNAAEIVSPNTFRSGTGKTTHIEFELKNRDNITLSLF
jgi:hypothetical protein